MTKRFTPEQIETWRRDGAVLFEQFFTPEEIEPVCADYHALYGDGIPKPAERDRSVGHRPRTIGQFNAEQFQNLDDMPFKASPAMNLIALHPALIELARAALGTDDVRLYQAHSWAKFTGTTDYEQPFHCDFKNHTLTVPADDPDLRTINFMIYITDVTLEHGAISYVPQSESDPITGKNRLMFLDNDMEAQEKLRAIERRGVGPAGSIFAYGIDVYHRGMNLTAPGGYRYTFAASYKVAGNDMIGFSAWPYSFYKPWHLIFDNATPDQLSCIGVPPPGDAFWTSRTLERAQDRWPNWDMSAYRAAL